MPNTNLWKTYCGFYDKSFDDQMDYSNKNKIFNPFFTTKTRGHGLGLSICKRFVEANGGSIEIEREKGKGTYIQS